MPKSDAAEDYDAALAGLVNQLHHIAETVRREGESWRDPSRRLDRVQCAMFIRGAIYERPALHQLVTRLLYAAIEAEHPTARSTPAQLIDGAATALEDRIGDLIRTGDDVEELAEAALRGAGVIR